MILPLLAGPYEQNAEKNKGPRTKAPFTSHHPLPPKRSFNEKLIDTGQLARYIRNS
jgi:hypothetical protein